MKKKKIDFKNSFCLLKKDSDDINSFTLLKYDSEDYNEIKDYQLSNNIHNHPLNISSLTGDICSICLVRKDCQYGNKCCNCSLIICDECSKLIISNYYLPNKHKHPLILLEKNIFKCGICGNIDNRKFNFYCDECNYGICPQCYSVN